MLVEHFLKYLLLKTRRDNENISITGTTGLSTTFSKLVNVVRNFSRAFLVTRTFSQNLIFKFRKWERKATKIWFSLLKNEKNTKH